jgi:hypothetical protein
LQAKAGCPAVLLLNDRYDSDWKVWVDGKPETLLRCNYLMRGVYLQPGAHAVEFRFQPPVGTLYVSLVAGFVSLLLIGYLALGQGKDTAPKPAQPPDLARAGSLHKPDCKGSTTRTEAGSGNIKGETTRLGVGRAAASLPRRERPQKSLKSGFLALPHGAMQSERPTFRLADDSGNTASRCAPPARQRGFKAQPCGT